MSTLTGAKNAADQIVCGILLLLCGHLDREGIAGIAGKDDPAIFRQCDRGITVGPGACDQLQIGVVNMKSATLWQRNSHSAAGSLTGLIPAGIAIFLNGTFGVASIDGGDIGGILVETAAHRQIVDAILFSNGDDAAVPASGSRDLHKGDSGMRILELIGEHVAGLCVAESDSCKGGTEGI